MSYSSRPGADGVTPRRVAAIPVEQSTAMREDQAVTVTGGPSGYAAVSLEAGCYRIGAGR